MAQAEAVRNKFSSEIPKSRWKTELGITHFGKSICFGAILPMYELIKQAFLGESPRRWKLEKQKNTRLLRMSMASSKGRSLENRNIEANVSPARCNRLVRLWNGLSPVMPRETCCYGNDSRISIQLKKQFRGPTLKRKSRLWNLYSSLKHLFK